VTGALVTEPTHDHRQAFVWRHGAPARTTCNGRSALARRYRDVLAALMPDQGGALPEARRILDLSSGSPPVVLAYRHLLGPKSF
jgi:hypothetical protein